jgi:hypothetical protein
VAEQHLQPERRGVSDAKQEPQTCPYVVGRTTLHCSLTPLTLTAEEREAIAYYIGTGGPDGVDATLRSLLERTK